MDLKEYYSQKEVRKELLKISKNREIQAWFNQQIAGKRPEVANYDGDILDLIRQGMTSMHVSEERWHDPLLLESGLLKRKLDELRKGWDLVIDLDSKNLEFSKIAGKLIIDALEFHEVKNYSLKFSGNHGVHIAIPFEAFPKEVNNVPIKDYFPDGVKIVTGYIKSMIKDFLATKILQTDSIDQIAKSVNKNKIDLIINGKFDPFTVVDIDDILISSRHLFRAPYSINEKSGLVSVPLKKIEDLNLENSKPENVKVKLSFLDPDNTKKNEAQQLLVQAFDWAKKARPIEMERIERKFETPTSAIKADFFPPCILQLMSGVKEDGRKRAIFILVNFLQSVGWDYDSIQKFLLDWNKKNYEPLRDNYITSQVSWTKRQGKKILPPNCENSSYYKSMGVKCDPGICSTCKNPVNYAVRLSRLNQKKKK